MRMLKRFLIAKLLGLLLVGTCWAQQTELDKKVTRLAHAIAATEGFNVKGSLPNRLHNPGDIRSRLKHAYEGQIGLNKSSYVIFKNDQFGWAALYEQIHRVLDDDSAYYNREMTFAQIARVYAASPQWPKTLCKILQIGPHLTFDEYFGLAPRVNVTEGNYGKTKRFSQQEPQTSEEMFVSTLYQSVPVSWPVYGPLDPERTRPAVEAASPEERVLNNERWVSSLIGGWETGS